MFERRALLSTLIACALAAASADAQTRNCRVAFAGTTFLKAAAERGLEPEQTNCSRVWTARNAFHAKPNAVCDLYFRNELWLPGGARFKNMTGQGSYSTKVEDTGLKLSIRPKGGFYLTQVSIAVSGPFAACKDVTIEDVLDGG